MVCVGRDFLPPCHGQGCLPLNQVAKAPSSLAWNTSRQVASTTSLSNLFQCLTSHTVKKICPISSLSLHFFRLKSLPIVLSLHALVRSPSPACLQDPFRHWRAALLQAEQPQLLQPFLLRELCQPSDLFYGLLWTHSSRSLSLLCWGLQSWTQDSMWGLTRAKQRGRITTVRAL